MVDDALSFLERHYLTHEGLWRKAGSRSQIDNAALVTNQDGRFPCEKIKPDDITSLLVRFMRDLPGGMVSAEAITQMLTVEPDARMYLKIINHFSSPAKKQLFERMLKHWQRVITCEENRMDAKATATCVFAVVFKEKLDVKMIDVLACIFDPSAPVQQAQTEAAAPQRTMGLTRRRTQGEQYEVSPTNSQHSAAAADPQEASLQASEAREDLKAESPTQVAPPKPTRVCRRCGRCPGDEYCVACKEDVCSEQCWEPNAERCWDCLGKDPQLDVAGTDDAEAPEER